MNCYILSTEINRQRMFMYLLVICKKFQYPERSTYFLSCLLGEANFHSDPTSVAFVNKNMILYERLNVHDPFVNIQRKPDDKTSRST